MVCHSLLNPQIPSPSVFPSAAFSVRHNRPPGRTVFFFAPIFGGTGVYRRHGCAAIVGHIALAPPLHRRSMHFEPPPYSRERYTQLLEYRGVAEESPHHVMLSILPNIPTARDNVVAWSVSLLAIEDDAEIHDWYPAVLHHSSTPLAMSQNVVPTYTSRGTQSDRRYSNNSERNPNVVPIKLAQLRSAYNSYRVWERHDTTTMREITPPDEFAEESENEHEEREQESEQENNGTNENVQKRNKQDEDQNENAQSHNSVECQALNVQSESDNESVQNDSANESEYESESENESENENEEESKLEHHQDECGNGGIYDPFRPGLSLLDPGETMRLLSLPPAAKFRDPVHLQPLGSSVVTGLESSRRYKNNLAGVLSHKDHGRALVVACGSELLVYQFDPLCHTPRKNPSLRFDTRPPFTLNLDQAALTWPYYPHTINSLKVCELWIDGAAVGVCVDDGNVLVWHAKTLFQEINRKSVLGADRFFRLKIAPDINLRVQASAWGIDFASACDGTEENHVLAVSANSQDITLFYHQQDGTFAEVVSHPILHNIPEVSFATYTVEKGLHRALVCAPSISAELVMFEFVFHTGESASSQEEATNTCEFDEPTVVLRTDLGSDCWTAKPVHSRYFKPVQSLRAMTGDPFIDDEVEVSQILVELSITEMSVDPRKSSAVGGAARWQFFDSPVVSLSNDPELSCSSKFSDFDKDHERMHLAYKSQCKENSDSALAAVTDFLVAVSTESRLGLFSAETFFCHAATKKLFTLDIPSNEDTKWCDRILLTLVIPELLSFVAASQSGLVSIMRLCQHRGLYGMRQEHLFPNALGLAVAENRLRTITGMCARNISVAPEYPRFCLYIVYSDGLVLTYELSAEV